MIRDRAAYAAEIRLGEVHAHVRDSEYAPDAGTTWYGVEPRTAEWYYCAVLAFPIGVTTYADGYAIGDEPTRDTWLAYARCPHVWQAGMMAVPAEDVETIAAMRSGDMECTRCGVTYEDRDAPTAEILSWEVRPIVRP